MIEEVTYQQYLQHLLSGERQGCSRIVLELLDKPVDLKDLFTCVFQRSLYTVGELWEGNRISVAKEHLATSITEGMLTLVYPVLFTSERAGKKAVITCSANEYHQVGGKMAADLFELHGWDGYFLGANTPGDDLVRMVDEIKPDLVGLSLSIYFNMPSLLTILDTLRHHYPNLDILVGGQAFRWGGAEKVLSYPRVVYVPTLDDLERLIANA